MSLGDILCQFLNNNLGTLWSSTTTVTSWSLSVWSSPISTWTSWSAITSSAVTVSIVVFRWSRPGPWSWPRSWSLSCWWCSGFTSGYSWWFCIVSGRRASSLCCWRWWSTFWTASWACHNGSQYWSKKKCWELESLCYQDVVDPKIARMKQTCEVLKWRTNDDCRKLGVNHKQASVQFVLRQ